MDESSDRSPDESPREATDEEVESAIADAEVARGGGPGTDARGGEGRAEPSSGPGEADIPESDLAAPASAGDGGHTLLEEYERQQESAWRKRLRQGAFWGVAIAVAVGLTLGGVVSLTESGLSDGVAFIVASVGMAVMVGIVFLSLRT
jgi:hypothetical protein